MLRMRRGVGEAAVCLLGAGDEGELAGSARLTVRSASDDGECSWWLIGGMSTSSSGPWRVDVTPLR